MLLSYYGINSFILWCSSNCLVVLTSTEVLPLIKSDGVQCALYFCLMFCGGYRGDNKEGQEESVFCITSQRLVASRFFRVTKSN